MYNLFGNNKDYNYLLGKKITKVEEKSGEIIFYTNDEKITINKFEPYCVCNVGEYIDNITFSDSQVNGIITSIETNVKEDEDDDNWDLIYRGNVTFFFENAQINMQVHGEDNGFYGVSFTMPVYIEKIKKEDN